MFKEFLKEKGISDEQFEKMDATEIADLQKEYNDAKNKELADLKEEISKSATTEELKNVSDKLDAFLEKSKEVNDETIKSLKDECKELKSILKTQGEEVKKIKDKKENESKEDPIFRSYKRKYRCY